MMMHKDCPLCGKQAYAEGVDIGVGIIYPPLYCPFCGWSSNEEDCPNSKNIEYCKSCTEYEKCFDPRQNKGDN